MPANAALTGTELTRLLLKDHDCPVQLSFVPDTEIGTAQVATMTAEMPLVEIPVTGASANWDTARKDHTVKVASPGGTLRGYYRLRKAPTDSILYIDEVTDADSGLLAQQNRTESIQAGDICTALERHDLWSVKPYIDGDGVIKQDYGIAAALNNRYPESIYNVAINGEPGDYMAMVANGGTQVIQAVVAQTEWSTGDGGAENHQWSYPAAFTGVSGATSNTFNATVPVGSWWIYDDITDGRGNITTIARWIRIHSPNDPPAQIMPTSDVRDWVGRTMDVRLIQARVSSIPPAARCMVWGVPTWGGLDVASATKKFCGYLYQQPFLHRPMWYETNAKILSPAHCLGMLQGYAASFDYDSTIATWDKVFGELSSVQFLTWWMARWRVANLLRTFNYTPFSTSGSIARRKLFSIPPGNIYEQLIFLSGMYDCNIGSRSDGEMIQKQLPWLLDHQSDVVTRATLTNSMYSFIGIEWRRRPRIGTMRWDGVYSTDLSSDTRVIAQAPGERTAGQISGSGTKNNKIFEGEEDAKQRCGDDYVAENNEHPQVQTELPNNWDFIEVVDAQRVVQVVPAEKSPTGQAITLTTIPSNVTKQWLGGRRAKIALQAVAETKGRPAKLIAVPVEQTNIFGKYSNALTTPIKQTPSSWGAANTKVPVNSGAEGLLLATEDGYVVRGGWTNISPTVAQRTAIGTAIKMIADPYDFKRLILYGSGGCLGLDNSSAASPVWKPLRVVGLGSGSDSGWTLTYDFTRSDGGWEPETSLNGAVYTPGVGWTHNDLNGVRTVSIQIQNLGTLTTTLESFAVTYDLTKGTYDATTNALRLTTNAVILLTKTNLDLIDGSNQTTAWTGSGGFINLIAVLYSCLDTNAPITYSGSATIKKIVLRGTGTPPVGATPAFTETFIGDIVGSPNRKGWFAWLSKKPVGGVDYVYINTTRDYFVKTATSKQVAKYVSTLTYSISMSSFNSGASGVGYVTAGDPAGADCKVYKSTNWFATISALGTTLASRGGAINVPYRKTATANNAGSSPQFIVVKGLNGANLEVVTLGGSTVTVITGGSKFPKSAQALHTFTLDGREVTLAASDGTGRKSSDGGGTWASAGTIPTTSGDVNGLNGSPTNVNFLLAFGNKCLAFTSNRGTAWTDLWSTYDTWRSANLGSGGTSIVSAFADLARLYSRAVTNP